MLRVVLKRVAAVVGAAVAAVVLTVPAANADPVDRWNNEVWARGNVDVRGDTTSWNLTITSFVDSASGWCVFVQITVDRNNVTDPDFQSQRLCANGQTAVWADSKHYRFTRGAKISLCRAAPLQPDHCQQVQYVPER